MNSLATMKQLMIKKRWQFLLSTLIAYVSLTPLNAENSATQMLALKSAKKWAVTDTRDKVRASSDETNRLISQALRPSDNLPPPPMRETSIKTEAASDAKVWMVIEAGQHALLSSQVSSSVQTINKRMGQAISAGEELVSLDPTLFAAREQKAYSELQVALALQQKIERLYSDRAASDVELAEVQAKTAGAEADYIIANEQLQQCFICSPFSGRVMRVFVEEHAFVDRGTPIIEVLNDEWLEGSLFVPFSALKYLYIGKKIPTHLTQDEHPIVATISEIDSGVDPASATVRIRVRIDNTDRSIRPGQMAEIPVSALVASYQGAIGND